MDRLVYCNGLKLTNGKDYKIINSKIVVDPYYVKGLNNELAVTRLVRDSNDCYSLLDEKLSDSNLYVECSKDDCTELVSVEQTRKNWVRLDFFVISGNVCKNCANDYLKQEITRNYQQLDKEKVELRDYEKTFDYLVRNGLLNCATDRISSIIKELTFSIKELKEQISVLQAISFDDQCGLGSEKVV